MHKVLVTGVNGFVGIHVVQELIACGITVVGIGGSGSSGKPSGLNSYITADLTQRAEADSINFTGIDGVIHLAGMAAVGPSFDSPMNYIVTNIGIELNLFESAKAQGANPRFVIVSSGSLYSTEAVLPLTELSAVRPTSPYAVSKLGQENLSQYYQNRGFECIIARPFNHFGPGQNPGFLAPDLASQIIKAERGESNNILVGNLDAQRDYTDVRDIAKAYVGLLKRGVAGENYNICSGYPKSGNEMLASMLQNSTVQPEIVKDLTRMRPADNPIIYGDHSKLTDHTGWRPTIDFETTAQDVLADWRLR